MLDLVASFRVQQAAALIVLGLLALPAGRQVGGVVILAGILVASVVAPSWLGTPRPIADDATRLELLSFNVGVSNPNRGEVAAFIAAEDPDVAFIFESSFEWEDALRDADLDLQIISVVPRGRVAGVTVLARPELRPGSLEVGIRGEVAALAVTVDGRRLEILGVHPPSPTSAARAGARDRMLAEAASWVSERDREVVVVGDLNATPWSHAFRALRDRAGLTDTRIGSGIQATWPAGAGLLAIPIDHVLVTGGLGFEDRRSGPAFGSSHRAVLVSVGLAG